MSAKGKCPHGCTGCSGHDVIAMAKTGIKKIGFVTIPIIGTNIVYSTGISNGKKGGFELITTGIDAMASSSVFNSIKDKLAKINTELASPENKEQALIADGMMYNGPGGKPIPGPVALIKISEKNKKQYCAMHKKVYGHDDFVVYQALICDAKGRHVLDPDYDEGLFRVQFPLFDI